MLVAALRFSSSALANLSLNALDQRFGEIVAADRDRAEPDRFALGDDQVGVFGAEVDDHRRALDPPVVVHGVVDRQRIHLHDLDVEPGVGEVVDVPVHQLLAHRKDADLDVRRLWFLEELVAPFDVVEREGDLLDRFEADDLGDLLGLNRRQLDEPGEARLPAHADRDAAALDAVPLHEIGQRCLDERLAVVAGLGEDVLVFDDFEIGDLGSFRTANEADRLEGAVSDVDAPGGTCRSHNLLSPRGRADLHIVRYGTGVIHRSQKVRMTIQAVPATRN